VGTRYCLSPVASPGPPVACSRPRHHPAPPAPLGIGFNPDFARRSIPSYPVAALPVDHPECRRTLSLLWSADANLTTAAQLMRTAITTWNWLS
jgi:hypothetical protein